MMPVVTWIVKACGSVGDTCSHLNCDSLWISRWFL